MTNSDTSMIGKICMVTGATDGIGKVVANMLAQQGATVIIVGRNSEKGEATINEIKQQTGNMAVEFLLADLSAQKEIHNIVVQFKSQYNHLDVLVNNAGASFRTYQESIDGIEMTFALNHLGYFLVTNLLLDTLKASSPSRIIIVSSEEHKRVKLDFNNLEGKQKYNSHRLYKQSKLTNLLFTYELARQLEGTGVTVNAVTPGLAKTKLGLEEGGFASFMKRLINFIAGKSPEEGAQAINYVASSPEVAGISGKYFKKNQIIPSSKDSYDDTTAKRLWDISVELTGLSG